MRTDRQNTPRRRKLYEELMAILSKSNISADRVVYVGKDTGESRTYVSESKELVELFFEKYNTA